MAFKQTTLLMLCVLAGCGVPGPAFRGIAPQSVMVGPSIFEVYVADMRALAVRVNPEWAPRFASVAPRGVAAIELVSGCRVSRLWGDQAVMEAYLDCGAAKQPAPVLLSARRYDCEIEPVYRGYADLICAPSP